MSIRIRKAQSSDTDCLSTLFKESRRRAVPQTDPAGSPVDEFQNQTQGEIVWLAVNDAQKVIGFISVKEADRFIHHLVVSSEYQPNEISSFLLRSLKPWLPLPYRLKCLATNQRGCAFYVKNGWREVERGGSPDGKFLVFEFGQSKPELVLTRST